MFVSLKVVCFTFLTLPCFRTLIQPELINANTFFPLSTGGLFITCGSLLSSLASIFSPHPNLSERSLHLDCRRKRRGDVPRTCRRYILASCKFLVIIVMNIPTSLLKKRFLISWECGDIFFFLAFEAGDGA